MQNYVEALEKLKRELVDGNKTKKAQRRLTESEKIAFEKDYLNGMSRDDMKEKWDLSSSGYYSVCKKLRLKEKAKAIAEHRPSDLLESLKVLGVSERNLEFVKGYALVFGCKPVDVINRLISVEAERLVGETMNESNKG
jgi:hypothetical protein